MQTGAGTGHNRIVLAGAGEMTPDKYIGSDVALWLRADRGVTLNGSDVSSWICQQTGMDFAQGTAAQQPAFEAASANLNNQPAVYFAAATNENLTAADATLLPNCDDSTWIFVLDIVTVAASAHILRHSTSSVIMFYRATTGLVGIYDGSGYRTSSADTGTTGAQAIEYAFDTGASQVGIRRDNAHLSGSPVGSYDKTIGIEGAGSLYLGNLGAGANPLQGRLAEAIGVSRALTAAERTWLYDTYLARYGL